MDIDISSMSCYIGGEYPPEIRRESYSSKDPLPRLNCKGFCMRKKRENPWLNTERRRESRVNEEDKVVIEVLSEVGLPRDRQLFSALTKDVSPGGVRVMTNMVLPPDTLIRMEIVLPKRRKLIHASGVVRWARSVYGEELFEMGIEFDQISSEDKMILLEHTYRRP